MTSLYRHIIKKAWQITRKLRYLWFLGFFAAFLGNGGEYQVLFQESEFVANQPEIVGFWTVALKLLMPNFDLNNAKLLTLFFLIVLAIALFVLLAWLIISSLAGLVKGAALARDNQRSSFKKLLLEGNKKFWPVLILVIIAKVLVYGFVIFALRPLILTTFTQNDLVNLLIVIVSFLIFIPVAIVVSLVTRYAVAYVMLGNQNWKVAFTNGWRLFRTNWLISLEMAFILFIINLVVGLIFVLLALLIFSPFFVITLGAPQLFGVLIYLSAFLLIVLTALIAAWLATFQISSWTLLYFRLTEGGKAYSKIVRWASALPDIFKKKTI